MKPPRLSLPGCKPSGVPHDCSRHRSAHYRVRGENRDPVDDRHHRPPHRAGPGPARHGRPRGRRPPALLLTVTADAAVIDHSVSGPAVTCGAGDLVLPRPLRLLFTAGWNLTESIGLPLAAYAIAAWFYGRDAGLVAGLAAIWLTALFRKVATGSVPGLLTISAVVLTLQTAVVLASGELWLFLL